MNTPVITENLPTEQDIRLARESSRILSTLLLTGAETRQIDIHDDQGTVRTVRIPGAAMRLLQEILTEIGQGNALSVIPIHAELTTQEAADVLNVSRPFLIQLLEKGEIPFHRVGTHRRLYYQDVITYRKRIDADRHKALEELAAQAQELGMGY